MNAPGYRNAHVNSFGFRSAQMSSPRTKEDENDAAKDPIAAAVAV